MSLAREVQQGMDGRFRTYKEQPRCQCCGHKDNMYVRYGPPEGYPTRTEAEGHL